MKITDYCHKSDAWLLALLAAAALVLNACEPAPGTRAAKKKVDWQRIDYEKIVCGSDHTKPGCQIDHDVDSIGKGKGKR